MSLFKRVSIGTRAMLLNNIHTTSGLISGAMGFVHSVHMHPKDPEHVSFISFIFDDVDIGFYINACENNPAIRIGRENRKVIFKGRCTVRM